MAYLCCFTDLNNKISFEVAETVPLDINDKYLEFAKYVSNPNEKQAIISMLNMYTLSDVYMIYSLMEGELWTPYAPASELSQSNQSNDLSESVSDLGLNDLGSNDLNNSIFSNFETIEEEPEISDPD